MMEQLKRYRFRYIEYFIGGLSVTVAIYIYAGFYFPDDYTLAFGLFPSVVLWVIRLAFPIVVAGLIVLYVRLRLKKTDYRAVIVLSITLFFAVLVTYQIADSMYQNWFEQHRQKYHPYLQLVPKKYVQRSDTVSGSLRVFCLGGSTTELTDSRGKDWESRVEMILRNEYGVSDIEVFNLGREWYTTLHTLINYETNLRQHRPSVIVIMQSVNDLLHNADFSVFSHGAFREDYGHFYGPVNRVIQHGSLLNKVNSIIAGLWYSHPKEVITTNYFPGLIPYERNLNTIIELAKHDSSKIILMTEPSLYKTEMTADEISVLGMLKVEAISDRSVWSVQTAKNGMERYNETLKLIAKKNNLSLIDLDSHVPKSLIFFRDDVHYTDTAFSVIAPFIAQGIYQSLNVQPKTENK